MSNSAYLQTPQEKEQYGVPTATDVEVMRASSLVDHYLQRPKGCVWTPDETGQPVYMAGANPTITYLYPGVINPGTQVMINLPNFVGQDDSLQFDVVIVDRLAQTGTMEACVVTSSGPGQLTFQTVVNAHNGNAGNPVTIERGLIIEEERPMPGQRSVTRLAEWPIANLLSGVGRYGYGRRSDQKLGYFYDVNLLSTLSAFGGPPIWNQFSVPSSSLNPSTGDLWVPAGLLLAYYTDVKVRYVGGWPQGSLPSEIKIATADLIKRMRDAPMGPMVRRFNTGKVTIERFADTIIDPDVKSLIRPYQANWMV